ncbi:ABC transporter permease [Cystobacter fuscus]|uniref:(GlcNAc)2 ABC transporter, permease component 1 n=1 Tax=Cystobacter fuscus (strain ATCC 25194 / DSM 2262 / NBRC 100088 / M29) TaxID=1242864 RepID=S9P1N5_CYSF2|nr:ABC transporter permease [Cystobacter fuscus]EPX58385.1 (GlcNAc)2 ABC transporter, permease component 1 [Cystobacter fuscus DSM 2262]WNG17488.1 ABC transporter permease [Cystobacter fuscus]
MRHLLKNLGLYALAAWASLTLNFIIPRMMPGDPASAMFARFAGQLQPEAIEALRAAFGFTNEPLLQQYFTYLSHMFQGDLGISVAYFPSSVTEVIGTGLGWTLLLSGTAVLISFGLGSLLGVVATWRRGGWLDSTLPPLLSFLGAFPYFWLAMVLLYGLGYTLGAFPLRHAYSDMLAPELSGEFIGSVAEHMVLPALSIVIASLGGWMLGMRSSMVGVLAEDYISLANAKGLSQGRIMFHYAARNALLPNITGFGMAIGFVLSGSLLTEIVFSYPGQGYLLIQAVRNQDYPLMQGIFLTITLAVLGANLLVDILYVWLDPRTRAR